MKIETPVVFPRRPFDPRPYMAVLPAGTTLLEAVQAVPSDIMPERFMEEGVICVNGEPIDRRYWKKFVCKPATPDRPMSVTFHLAPAGGLSKSGGGGSGGSKGGGGKGVLTIIAAIAIIAVATFISAGGLTVLAPGLFSAGLFGAGTLGASLAAAAVSSLGLLALNSLTPTPSVESETFSDRTRQDKSSFSDGNVLTPGGIIPRVIGYHKIFPPLVSSPLIDVVDDNEVIEAMYALAGPHSWEDVRIDDFLIDDLEDIEYSVREGWTDDPDVVLFERYGIVESPQTEMTQHILDEDLKRRFKHPSTPERDLPTWHGFVIPAEPDEVWIQLIATQGYYNQVTDADVIGVPYRVRIRPEGSSTWINMPEAILWNRVSSAFRRMIKLKFVEGSGDIPSAPTIPTTYGWLHAFYDVPPQTTNNPVGVPSFGGWEADAHFNSGGAINTPLYTHQSQDEVVFWLFGSTFANVGRRWELQIIRGNGMIRSLFTQSTYAYNALGNDVHDHFLYKLSDGSGSSESVTTGEAIVPTNQDNIISSTVIIRVSSVYNEVPVRRKSEEQASGLALLAIKGRNKSLTKVSAIAAGYVPDWNGTEWAGYVTTSNPAPHFRDILVGELNYDAIAPEIVDSANLVGWRQTCIDYEMSVDLIAEGRSVAELLTTVAACGRAKPRFSDLLGVLIDSPRSQEAPIQLFSPRNSSGFRFDIPFSKRPDGYIVTYKNENAGYNDDQIIVYDPSSSPETAGSFESITIEGIVDTDRVVKRMLFDIGQMDYRPASYALEVDIEGLACRRGDLVGVSHDIIQPRAGFARVKEIFVSGPNTVGVRVDSELQLSTGTDFFGLANVFTESDIFLVGIAMGCAIRLSDGSIITKALTSVGLTDELDFEVPFTTPAALIEDCLVVVGEVDQEYGRFIVKELIPQQDLTARLILLAEAPELHPYYEEDFEDFSIAAGIPAGFTSVWSPTGITYSIQAEGIASSRSGIEFKMTKTTNDLSLATWDLLEESYADLEVTAGLYIIAAGGASAIQSGVAARVSGAAASEEGYALVFMSTAGSAVGGGIAIHRYVAGVATSIGSAAFSWAANTRYYLKLSVVGRYIKGKVWEHNTSEPDDWNIEVYEESDDRIVTSGQVGLLGLRSENDPAFDFISVQALEVIKE